MEKRLMVFVCATLLVLTCTSEDNSGDYELQRAETRTWPSAGISQINITTINGEITVTDTQDTLVTAVITRACTGSDSVDAEEHIDDIEITESLVSGLLRLEADMPDTNDCDYRADFDITAPASKYLDLSTVNGDILLQDMSAGARCRVTNGRITTESMQGGIDGATVNGTILCDMEDLGANESVLLAATNGDVTLSLPSDVSVDFDASTTNGVVTVTGFSSVIYTIDQANHKAGTIGSGAGNATIDIGVVNGNITIQAR